MALHRAVSGGWILACLLAASACGSGSAHPAAAQAAQATPATARRPRERAGVRAVPGIRRRGQPAPVAAAAWFARHGGVAGSRPGAGGRPPARAATDGRIWPGHTPRRPGTRPDMAGRQRQLVLLTNAVRRYNSPDGSALPPHPCPVGGSSGRSRTASEGPVKAEPVIVRSRLKAQEEVAGIVLLAGMQDVPRRYLQGVVPGARHRAAGAHLVAPGGPAPPCRVLLERGSYPAASSLRIDPEAST